MRIRDWRTLVLTATLLGLLLAAAPHEGVSKDKDWEVTLLGSPSAWTNVYPNNINEKGNIIGFWDQTTGAGYEIHAVSWKSVKSSPVQLETLSGDTNSWAADINASGVGCGSSGIFPTAHGVVWDNHGKVKDMHPTSAGFEMSQIWGINDRGDACGMLFDRAIGRRPYAWPKKGDPFMPEFDADEYYGGMALSIDKSGRMSGFGWEKPIGWAHALVWTPKGEVYDLHDDIVDAFDGEGLLYSIAWEATDHGEICGEAGTGVDSYVWVWTMDDGVVFLDQDDTDVAVAWQSAGKVVIGSVGGNDLSPADAEAAIWKRGTEKGRTTWTLSKIPTVSGYEGMVAIGANQEGDFVGMAVDSDGKVRAWHTKFPHGK